MKTGDLVQVESDDKKVLSLILMYKIGLPQPSSLDSYLGSYARVTTPPDSISIVITQSHSGQCVIWPKDCLRLVSHSILPGTIVRIAHDRTYLRGFMPAGVVPRPFPAALYTVHNRAARSDGNIFFNLIGSPHVRGIEWPEQALVPQNDFPEDKKPTQEKPDLDSVLEGLYDCLAGKRGDTSELLEDYKKMTGKERPGFMS